VKLPLSLQKTRAQTNTHAHTSESKDQSMRFKKKLFRSLPQKFKLTFGIRLTMMAIEKYTQPESKLPRATTSTSSLSMLRELAKSNGYSNKHTIQQTNKIEKILLPTNTRSSGTNNNNKCQAGRKQKHEIHLIRKLMFGRPICNPLIRCELVLLLVLRTTKSSLRYMYPTLYLQVGLFLQRRNHPTKASTFGSIVEKWSHMRMASMGA